MAIGVIIYGKSGSGKSRSCKTLPPNTLYINVEGKPLPFKNNFKNVIHTTNANEIVSKLKAAAAQGIKTAVVDDCGYLMTEYFMKHHRDHKGNAIFDMYNDIGDLMYSVLAVTRALPDDMIVYYMFHEDKNEFGDTCLRTIGKLLNEKVCIEGMFTISLRCVTIKGEHFFLTNTEGDDITKSPEGMFDDIEIENDLGFVDSKIREYYGLKPIKEDNNNAKK